MHPALVESFDRVGMPRQAAIAWGGDPASLQLLGESQNFIYSFAGTGSARRVLRIAHASHRSRPDIEAELEFLLFLRAQDCGIAAPIASAAGNLVEPVGPQTDEYHAAVFEYVPGEPFKWGGDKENRKTLVDLGRWLGKLHSCSRQYHPKRTLRFSWYEDELYANPDGYFPESEPGLRKELGELIHWINRHDASRENYGLIHGDLWGTNFRYIAGRVVAFDFDDCCQHWFTYDLAITLAAARKLPERYRKPYLQCLLDGYTEQNSLCGDGAAEIEWFSRLAAMHRYAHALRDFDRGHLIAAQRKALDERRREVLEPIRWS